LIGNLEEKTSARSRHRCYDNVKVYIKEIRRGDVDWIYLAGDREN
jgi:hypothetical protein